MKINFNIETAFYKTMGAILLTPAIIGVYFFVVSGVIKSHGDFQDSELSYSKLWSGRIEYYSEDLDRPITTREGSGGGGYASPIPIYMGLMAIAGVLIITKKAED